MFEIPDVSSARSTTIQLLIDEKDGELLVLPVAVVAVAEAEAEAAAVVVGRAVRRCRRTASFPYLERQVGLDEALCVRLRDFSSKML